MPNIVLDEWLDLGVRGCRSITVTQRRTVPGFFEMQTPIAYWTMDEANGAIRADSIGSNDLNEFTGSVPNVSGVISDAARVNSSGGLERNSITGLWTFANGITVAGWFKFLSSPISDPGNFGTLGFGLFGGSGERFRLLAFTDGNLYAEARTSIGLTSQALFSGFSTNTFLFIRMWVDPDDNKVHCKINEGATQDGGSAMAPATIPALSIQFPGLLTDVDVDEVGIYGTVLTDEDGAFLYNSGAGNRPPFS